MYALVHKNEIVTYISSWTPFISYDEQGNALHGIDANTSYVPTVTEIGFRVCDVSNTQFEVSSDQFTWYECGDILNDESHYYDTETQTIKLKPADVENPNPLKKKK